MQQTDFFFSPVVDLRHHTLPAHIMDAIDAVYSACRTINQPNKYGPAIEVIIIDAIHQDYDSKFHKPALTYDPVKKVLEAGVKVELDKILGCTFPKAAEYYIELALNVFDWAEGEVKDYNFERLKRDLQEAMQEEIRVFE